jgi:RHS repeat-associated protein
MNGIDFSSGRCEKCECSLIVGPVSGDGPGREEVPRVRVMTTDKATGAGMTQRRLIEPPDQPRDFFCQITYDSLGQVIAGNKYWLDGTPVAGQQFDYTFDTIGNRTQTKAGGDQNGAGLRVASYSANALNQYTSRDVPGAVDVMGIALGTNTVTVNSLATYRKGEYFRKELDVDNSGNPVWQSITVAASGETTVTGNQFVPKTAEAFGYDADGNLTSDGRWNYTWDAENRVVAMAANTTTGPTNSMKFEYDWQGRRIHKQVWGNTNWNGTPTNDVKFLYDRWNPIAQLNASNNNVIQLYIWGLDLSGTMQGAGGVGGLLEVNDTANGVHFVGYDGNGNVSALVKASDGSVSACYEYGPFGELLRATGPMAKVNPFRFSTKYQDEETDLLYYGYRYYGASIGRWLGRDPAEEDGGINLYEFSENDSLNRIDLLGETAYLGFKELEKTRGLCGVFMWKIEWHVNGTKKKKSPEADSGLIYQKVTQEGTFYDYAFGYEIQRSFGPKDIYEGWWWPGLATHFPVDAWSLVGDPLPIKGELTYKAIAYYTKDHIDTAIWRPSPRGSSVDVVADTTKAFSPPNADSNQVTRTLKAKWDCTKKMCNTKLNTKTELETK